MHRAGLQGLDDIMLFCKEQEKNITITPFIIRASERFGSRRQSPHRQYSTAVTEGLFTAQYLMQQLTAAIIDPKLLVDVIRYLLLCCCRSEAT